jgi:hypothetical protein
MYKSLMAVLSRRMGDDEKGLLMQRGGGHSTGELLGSGGIEDLEHALLSIDFNLLTVGVFDGGVVL